MPPEPAVAGAEDLRRAHAVLERFERAVGNSDALYSAFAAVSRAGGGPGTPEEMFSWNTRTEEMLARPWDWLAAVSAEAQRVGNHLLVARVCLFTEMWMTTFLPRMNLAGSFDACLGPAPDRPRAQIATIGLDAMAHLPADHVVASNQTGSISVRDARLTCAVALATLAERADAGVARDVADRALRIVQTGDDQPPPDEVENEIAALVLRGGLSEALDRGTRHLAQCRQDRGGEDPATIRATAALGFAQLRAGRLYDVVTTLEPAHPVAVRVLGDGDFSTLRIAANLAGALRDTQRPERALSLLHDALAASQKPAGQDDAGTLAIRSELALTQTALGQHAEAIRTHRQVLEARTRVLGRDHADTLTSGDLLGQAYRAAGDLEQAIPQIESVTATCQEALGAEHPDTLSSQYNLASAYAEAGRLDEAIARYEATLAARRRVLGESHLHTLNTMNGLAIVWMQAGRDQQALALLEEAAACCAETLTPDHPIARNLEASLMMARMMASPPPTTGSAAAPPPANRDGPKLRQIASFKNPGKGMGFGQAWSPAGDRLAVAGFDSSVVVFDVSSGKQLLQTPRSGTVSCVSWSPDGRTLASATAQRTVHLFDVDAGQELRHATGHHDEIRSIAYAPDGRLIATCANDGKLLIWSAADLNNVVGTVDAHTGRARAVAWAPDATGLATGGQDGAVRFWRANTWSLSTALTDHTGEVSSVAYSPDRRYLASGSLDSTVRVWDLARQRYHQVLDANRWWVISLAFSPDSGLLAALSNEELLVLDIRTGETVSTANPPIGAHSISWRPDSRHIATIGYTADIWELPP